MRALMLTMTLAAVLASPVLAQNVTPGGGVRPLPRCSAVVPVCQNTCRTKRTQCEARPGASNAQCSSQFSSCFKGCFAIDCAR